MAPLRKTFSRPGQLRVEAGADLQKAGDTSPDPNPPLGGIGDAAQNLQERRLAGAIAPDDPDDFAAPDFEVQVPQRPEFLERGASFQRRAHPAERRSHRALDDVTQALSALALRADDVALRETLDGDDRFVHGAPRIAWSQSSAMDW